MKRPHVDYKYFYIKELVEESGGGKQMDLSFKQRGQLSDQSYS